MDRLSERDWRIVEKAGYTQIKSVMSHPSTLISYCIFLLLLFSGTLGWIFGIFGTIFSFMLLLSSSIPGFICYRLDMNYRLKCYEKGLEIRAQEVARQDEEVARQDEEKEKEIEKDKKRVIKYVQETISKGGLENYRNAIDTFGIDPDYAQLDNHFGGGINTKKLILGVKAKIAKELERLLRYEEAIEVWESLENHDEAKRIRQKMIDEKKVKVTQKIIHGDEVTKTEIKDSVVSKSNIGSGGDDKLTKIKELKDLHDAGAIDADEFKQMKKEILGK